MNEETVRRSLRSLDDVPVPPLATLRPSRTRPGQRVLRGAFEVVGVIAIIAIALGLGRALSGLRNEHAAVGSPSSVTASAASRPSEMPTYRFRAETADEVTTGMQRDSFVTPTLGATVRLGTPLFVRGLRPGDLNIWLVPQLDGSTAIGVWVVQVAGDGFGTTTEHAGGPDRQPIAVPPVSEEDARVLGADTSDPVIGSQLVWTQARPGSTSLVNEINPLWELSRQSGKTVYVTSNRQVLSRAAVDALR